MEIMTAIAAARALSEFVPGLARLLGGERAGDVAQKVIDVAKEITGQADPVAAAESVRANAELQAKLAQALAPVLVAEYEAETRQLETVNETMRSELASDDKYAKRWRPSFGYAATATWFVQGVLVFGLLTYTVLKMPEKIGVVSDAIVAILEALASHWLYALTVLGVAVWKRSDDKRIAANQPGLLDALTSRITGRTP